MRVVRVGPLPDRAIEAAAEFHAKVVPEVIPMLTATAPPLEGEGDHAKHGGGVSPSRYGDTPPSAPAALPPPLAGEDLVLIFPPAPYGHRGWRLAVVQDLARAAAPLRVNGVVGDDAEAIAATLVWLEQAPGITGQLLSVQTG